MIGLRAIGLLLSALASAAVAGAPSPDAPRMLLHLLSYVAQDYGGAVGNGQVLNQEEYAEQVEFSRTAWETAQTIDTLRANPRIQSDLRHLRELIGQKADSRQIAETVGRAKSEILLATGLPVAPSHWPDRAHGKALFEQSCQQCHGVTGHGDGPAAGNQNPPPFNFHSDKGAGLSPFQAFNAIRLGVPGTTMAPFSLFSDADTWDLAFYVISLRHPEGESQRGIETGPAAGVSLEQAATLSDLELADRMIGSREERERAVAAVRLHGGETAGSSSTLGLAIEELKKTLALAQEGQWPEAQAAAVKAYLDGVEPAEAELRSRDAGFTASLEQSMAEVRGVLQRRAPIADVESKIASADGALRRAEGVLAQGIASPAFTFSVAAGIFLREAFEAVLILITLLGVIRSMGTRSALLAVHAGWMIAVLFGLVTWFFSGWLIAISGAQREMLEAVTSLLAVTVLLYFGFWLHQKSEFGKWHAFIKDKVNSAVEGKKLWALGMISFMAVFREAFETVIFLRALLIEAGPQQQMAMAAGVILSFILVLALAAALVRFSVKIPLRQLFALSSLVMVVLALILVGKAAHSFQETGLLTVTTLPVSLHVDLIGVYPTYETLVPQLAVIAVAFGYWLYSRRFALK